MAEETTDDTRDISEDRMQINVGDGDQATRFLEDKEVGSLIAIKGVVARILSKDKGKLDLQVQEVEFDKTGTAGLNNADTRKPPETPPPPEEQPDVAILLSVPEPEEQSTVGGGGNPPSNNVT